MKLKTLNVKGATALEYGLVAGLVSLGIIVAFEDFVKLMSQDGTAANDIDINQDGTVDTADLGVIPALSEKVKTILGEFAEPTVAEAPAEQPAA